MFIDYVALMLANLAASLFLVGTLAIFYPDRQPKRVAPGLLVTGFIGTVTGLDTIFHWPLPGSYNIAFGAPATALGVLLFVGGLALLLDWDLLSLTIFAVIFGAVSIILGLRIAVLGMTNSPPLATAGFVLAGVAGLLSMPFYFFKRSLGLKVLLVVVLFLAAVIWAFTAFGAYWQHLEDFSKWVPATMGK
jgi:putative membrane protein